MNENPRLHQCGRGCLVAEAGFEPTTCGVMSAPSYRCSTLQYDDPDVTWRRGRVRGSGHKLLIASGMDAGPSPRISSIPRAATMRDARPAQTPAHYRDRQTPADRQGDPQKRGLNQKRSRAMIHDCVSQNTIAFLNAVKRFCATSCAP